MKVTELKAALAERGLDTKGNKAALVERLGAALNDDNNDNLNDNDNNESNDGSRDKEHTSNGAELYNPEEETPSSPEDNGGAENGENEVEAGFEGHEFVKSKPTGISFGLHQPTKVKPQPNELKPLTDDHESDQTVARQGAAAFFSGHQTPAETGAQGQEADVPLPPTTSFMEESEDEEEEGPPGLGDVKLPTDVFNKVSYMIIM